MANDTKIEWTDHTFNPWWGCRRVSPACDNCYAADMATRYRHDVWDNGRFRFLGDNNWQDPYRWDAQAQKEGRRHRVFCASMADVFDKEAPEELRQKLWNVIRDTENLDWQLLTKRHKQIQKKLPSDLVGHPRVWLGVSAEDELRFWQRVPVLKEVDASVRFLSVEPLLEEIPVTAEQLEGIHWVIVGGESGPNFRPMEEKWALRFRDACAEAGVAFFFKQWSGPHPKKLGRVLDGKIWNQFPGWTTPAVKLIKVRVDEVRVNERPRPIKEEFLGELAASMHKIGQQAPITVWSDDDQYHLVAGLHRLEAAKKLGWAEIDAVVTTAEEINRLIWEIDENLMRAELSAVERAEQTAKRKELWEARPQIIEEVQQDTGGLILAGSLKDGRAKGPQHEKGFAQETAERTGRSKAAINNEIRIGENVVPDVMEKLKAAGPDSPLGKVADTQVELDKLSRMPDAKQRLIVREIEEGKRASVRSNVGENKLEKLKKLWYQTEGDEQVQFIDWLREEYPEVLAPPPKADTKPSVSLIRDPRISEARDYQ